VPLARHLPGPALLVATAALLAGCAQPGQLGHESDAVPSASAAPAPTTEPALPGVPDVPVTQAGSDARGRLDRPVDISTPGPAELLVRTEVLQPGQASGWVRHPGTVITVVRSGTVTVQRAPTPASRDRSARGRRSSWRTAGPTSCATTARTRSC
jgi:hypothetical protein